MGEGGSNQSTFGRSVFVGTSSNNEQVIQALLVTAEIFLSDEPALAEAPYPGELSTWVADLMSKPIDLSLFNNQDAAPSIERQFIQESASALVDTRRPSEVEVTKRVFVEGVSSDDVRHAFAVLQGGDRDAIKALQNETVLKLQPRIGDKTPELLAVAMAQLTRIRAMRVAFLCMVLHKTHPLSLISRARTGDRRAVLDLVKMDKLFAIDSCTRSAIRNATLRTDKSFLDQLARSLRTRPKAGAKKVCRLYLYMIWSVKAKVPTLPVLQLLLDPNGTKFRTFTAFERFVERCYKDFLTIQEAASAEAPTSVKSDPSQIT